MILKIKVIEYPEKRDGIRFQIQKALQNPSSPEMSRRCEVNSDTTEGVGYGSGGCASIEPI